MKILKHGSFMNRGNIFYNWLFVILYFLNECKIYSNKMILTPRALILKMFFFLIVKELNNETYFARASSMVNFIFFFKKEYSKYILSPLYSLFINNTLSFIKFTNFTHLFCFNINSTQLLFTVS